MNTLHHQDIHRLEEATSEKEVREILDHPFFAKKTL